VREITKRDTRILIFDHLAEMFDHATGSFFETVRGAVSQRNLCTVALSGGSTPKGLYTLLKKRIEAGDAKPIDWSRVHFFFGDERMVPADHIDSNYRMAWESLLSGAELARSHVHRVKTELGPEAAAAEYQERFRQVCGAPTPQLDLVLLGMGADGHTASLFPGTTAINERERWVCTTWVEKLATHRITVTYPLIKQARTVHFLVAGEEKAPALAAIFDKKQDLPAARVRSGGELSWWITKDAAPPGW
jgi:6-phosphogluconolactonase